MGNYERDFKISMFKMFKVKNGLGTARKIGISYNRLDV